jgi:hypothetical protein
MFYDKSDSEFPQWREQLNQDSSRDQASAGGEQDNHSGEGFCIPAKSAYDREVIASVWECAETVPGTDSVIWRKDEYGAWIHRADYGRRTSEFGWEIFDPGVGRHCQGVYAMRPMQWQSYISQYSTLM